MIIKILSYAASLKDLLSDKLNEIGFTAETVDYSQALLPQLKDADVIVNGLGTVDKSIIDACPKLKLVHQVGTGIDNVDVDYCTSKAVFVANVPNTNNVSVAEHTIFLMIYLAKNIKNAGSSLMKRRVINVLGSELHRKTLLIIGLGDTGIEVAKLAKSFSSPTFSLLFTIVCRNLCECCIPKLFLVKAIIKEAKNTVEGERFIIITMVPFVRAAEWH